MSRAVVSRKVERLLDRKGFGGERHQVRGGELMLYFSTSKVAAQVRALLVHSGIAAEQYNERVTVYLDAEEEKIA
jgi:hypothetical protein